MIRWTSVAITTDSLGAGTATTAAPVIGEICEIRSNAASFSSTADYTVTRNGPAGGTVAYYTNATGPFSFSPGVQVYDTAGNKVLYSSATGGTATVPAVSADYLTVTVAQGGSVVSGTIHIFYNE